MVALAAGLAMGLLGACAQQEVPPGGPEDLRPPVIVRTEPEAYASLDEVDAVRVRHALDHHAVLQGVVLVCVVRVLEGEPARALRVFLHLHRLEVATLGEVHAAR